MCKTKIGGLYMYHTFEHHEFASLWLFIRVTVGANFKLKTILYRVHLFRACLCGRHYIWQVHQFQLSCISSVFAEILLQLLCRHCRLRLVDSKSCDRIACKLVIIHSGSDLETDDDD